MKWGSLNSVDHRIVPARSRMSDGESRARAIFAVIDWAVYGRVDDECLATAKRIQRQWGITRKEVVRKAHLMRMCQTTVSAVLTVFDGQGDPFSSLPATSPTHFRDAGRPAGRSGRRQAGEGGGDA